MQPKVSVIIPIFNSSKYLKECLDSIANQTLKELQVIMIDDGSTDDSAKICRDYCDINPYFEYYYKENGGSASARNVGLEHAVSEYIGYVDSDDTVLPEYFETLYRYAVENDADIVFLPYAAGRKNANLYINPKNGLYDSEEIELNILPNVLPRVNEFGTFRSIDWSNCSRLFRRKLVENKRIRYYTGSRRCEDLAFILECTLFAQSYYVCDEENYYNYRPSENSKSRHYTKDMWESIHALMAYMNDVIVRSGTKIKDMHFGECVFYFVCMVMRNEVLGAERKDALANINHVLNDLMCLDAIIAIDPAKLNKKYKKYYDAIKTKKANKVINTIRYDEWKRNKAGSFIDKIMQNSTINKLYGFVKRK